VAKKRPIVNIDNKPEIHLENELFQNEVLRPILKMQHEITLKLFSKNIDNLGIVWKDLKKSKKNQCVENQLSKNIQFKNLVIGVVAGQFNELEMDKYLLNSREYNKRILQMTIQRIVSTI
tara:strand:- start:1878 stop:2237 length:360 start_codon:yes stop_codon:yes gene_type:complete